MRPARTSQASATMAPPARSPRRWARSVKVLEEKELSGHNPVFDVCSCRHCRFGPAEDHGCESHNSVLAAQMVQRVLGPATATFGFRTWAQRRELGAADDRRKSPLMIRDPVVRRFSAHEGTTVQASGGFSELVSLLMGVRSAGPKLSRSRADICPHSARSRLRCRHHSEDVVILGIALQSSRRIRVDPHDWAPRALQYVRPLF